MNSQRKSPLEFEIGTILRQEPKTFAHGSLSDLYMSHHLRRSNICHMGHSVGGFQARNGQLVEYGVVQRRACVQWRFSQSLDQTMGQNQFLWRETAESVSEPEPAERKLPARRLHLHQQNRALFFGPKNVLLPDGENDWVITSPVMLKA